MRLHMNLRSCFHKIREVAVAIAAIASIAVLSAADTARAAVNPYSVDGNTLHLWHLDEADTSTQASDATGSLDLMGKLNGATFGTSSFTGFSTALNTAADALSLVGGNSIDPVDPPPHRPILAAAASLSNAGGDNVPLTWAGADGAFTLEALIKFDAGFNPAATDYRNTPLPAPPSGGGPGAYAMEILAAEAEDNAGRLFQFRIDQIGFGGAANIGDGPLDTTQTRLEFHNLRGIVNNQAFIANLPTVGANAINNTDWFHVAVAYNGMEATPNNLSFYWTKVDAGVTAANLLAQGEMTMDPVQSSTGFAVGNETRDAGVGTGEGESFVGLIDEVRISSVARADGEFIFSGGEGCIAGDFNCNGAVENADLTLLLNNWAQAVPPVPAGWIGSPPPTGPAIDNDELTALLNNWGNIAGGGGNSPSGVPEPTGLAISATLLWLVSMSRRAAGTNILPWGNML